MKAFGILASAIVVAIGALTGAPACAQTAKVPSTWGLNPGGAVVSASGATVAGGDITFTAAGQSVVIDAASAGGFTLQVAGTWSGALSVQWSEKPTSGFRPGALFSPDNVGGAPEATAITASQQYAGNAYGRYMKITSTAWSSGSATVSPALQAARFPARAVAVSGRTTVVAATPAVTAGSAYAAGNVVGGLLTFPGVAAADNPTGLVQSVALHFKSAQTAPTDLVFCSQPLSATTLADKAAVSLDPADVGKCRVFHVTDCTSLGTPTYCAAEGLASPFVIPAGTDAYGFLVTRGAPVFASTSDVSVSLRVVR